MIKNTLIKQAPFGYKVKKKRKELRMTLEELGKKISSDKD